MESILKVEEVTAYRFEETCANESLVHDLLGTRCDPYVNKMLSGKVFYTHLFRESIPCANISV